MKNATGILDISQGFDPDFLRKILTRDITPTECIFDLVDNSIDAARNSIRRQSVVKLDSYSLPASYAGYEIDIVISNGTISIKDNCSGFSRTTLSNDAFVVGKASHHEQGIGHFGVGMKRALLALGEDYQITTRNGSFAADLHFSASDIANSSKPLRATIITPADNVGTSLKISGLRTGASHELIGRTQEDELIKNLPVYPLDPR